jgi:ribosomal protein S8
MRLLLLFALCFFSCSTNSSNSNETSSTSEVTTSDIANSGDVNNLDVIRGLQCANVRFNNPNTGSSGAYVLEVMVDDGYVTDIHFADGHLDTSHFTAALLDDNNTCSITTDRGKVYQIEILDSFEQCQKREAQEVQCSGITKSGNRCRRHTSHPSGRCFQHQ